MVFSVLRAPAGPYIKQRQVIPRRIPGSLAELNGARTIEADGNAQNTANVSVSESAIWEMAI